MSFSRVHSFFSNTEKHIPLQAGVDDLLPGD